MTKILTTTLFVLAGYACGGPVDNAQSVDESELSYASRTPPSCECGETTMGGFTDCHACPLTKAIATEKQPSQTRSPSNTLAAPGGPAEAEHCCDGCGTVGTGQGCHDGGGAGNSCQPDECFLDCACGETTQGGNVTCHSC